MYEDNVLKIKKIKKMNKKNVLVFIDSGCVKYVLFELGIDIQILF